MRPGGYSANTWLEPGTPMARHAPRFLVDRPEIGARPTAVPLRRASPELMIHATSRLGVAAAILVAVVRAQNPPPSDNPARPPTPPTGAVPPSLGTELQLPTDRVIAQISG